MLSLAECIAAAVTCWLAFVVLFGYAFDVAGFGVQYLGAYARWRLRRYPHWAAYRRIPLEIEADWEARAAE